MDFHRPVVRWLTLLVALLALLVVVLLLRAPRTGVVALPTPASTDEALLATLLPTPLPTSAAPLSTPPASATPLAAPATEVAPTQAPQIAIDAATSPLTITFSLRGQIPAGADEALLWYDTIAGHAVRRIALDDAHTISTSITITPTQEGLTRTETLDNQLDYWWAVRDQRGAIIRRAGSLALSDPLAALSQTAPVTAPAKLAWVERETPHFQLHAPPGTAAARDLDALTRVAEASYDQAASVIAPTKPVSIPVYLVPRVFWQGGVAYGQKDGLVISYLDRNYLGVPAWSYLVHEVTHVLGAYLLPSDGQVGGLLGEGVAVYDAGGHYGPEPIDAWAAALASSDRYIPLCRLRYDFYGAQHEIAYQEGASFVGYLIRTYGLDAFRQIYKAQRPPPDSRKVGVEEFCTADNQRIVEPTGKTAAALEQAWLDALKSTPPTDEQRRSWELTIRFFDTMRRYQEQQDRPARDLPPPPTTWDRATAAKFLNPATGRRAVVLETMLGAAEQAIRAGDVEHAGALLDEIDGSLTAGDAPAGPLAHDYDAIAGLLDEQARALRIGDQAMLSGTLTTSDLAADLPFSAGELLYDLRYSLVSLDVRGDTAEGMVDVSGASLSGPALDRALYRAHFAHTAAGWRMTGWAKETATLALPPGHVG